MSSYQSFRQKIVAAYYTDPSMATNILTEVKGNRFYITFNRPKRYNAFSYDMFYTFTHSIIAANQNPDVKFIIISGAAGNFTSGNDLSNFTNSTFTSMGSTEQMAQ
jgi:enoyl-CoA hydratase/carnithine racemase